MSTAHGQVNFTRFYEAYKKVSLERCDFIRGSDCHSLKFYILGTRKMHLPKPGKIHVKYRHESKGIKRKTPLTNHGQAGAATSVSARTVEAAAAETRGLEMVSRHTGPCAPGSGELLTQ